MSLALFHPLVQEWFRSSLGAPTAAQSRGWAAIAEARHTLIAAPTGSGKTLAAFLTAIDELTRDGLARPLPDEVRVVYVSPLKALSADIQRNLAEPCRALRALAAASGIDAPAITSAVRTGDTPASERAAMIRRPPHILVTTPESLYLLLTSERSRQMLATTRTVIVDEIHAVIGTRRGAHLALSLERLQQVAQRPLLRIGLSATQKPIDEVARFLAGGNPCAIVDEGHRRAIDLSVEIPRSPLEAVMAHEVWEEYYDRLAALVRAHRTTLIFVNTRRMAERLARHLTDRLGEGAVAAHHGSLAKDTRQDAEARLKSGALRAIVATASLELGIDIGHIDLVCQVGSPKRIATLLQRVGRSGHTISGTPKGRVFPSTRDDLVECAALLRAVRRGELDAIVPQDRALDVLAQQLVAECACREYGEDELFSLARRAWPYRELARAEFDAVLKMIADGFSTRRGRRAALVHRDEVNATARGRRGARLLAQTSGGAIPEVADYRVVLDPGDTLVGTLNEDFAIESNAGDIFQLGNASWRILQVAGGTVRVADAQGAPPTIPFWLGEAPARSDELSAAVSDLRREVESRLPDRSVAAVWVEQETGMSAEAADQLVGYLNEGRTALGVMPTQDTLVLERFFDESGGMQLVLHAPFGSRINKAWALALRKRFCRQFNFELQAAATEDALLLSLGPMHSFPLSDVFRYLHPETTRDVLVQAFLDAPIFQTRWRWNATLALAVPRSRAGRKLAPQIQRMLAEDLLASVFPDAAACLENIPGDRQVPDHPLVDQTVRDCLEEAMDFEGLRRVLERIHAGQLRLVARDTPEPSVFSDEILDARPYAFLDDAPLEERRSHAVQTRRGADRADEFGALDPAAIARVRDEERPDPRDADELHDALMTAGFLTIEELDGRTDLLSSLAHVRRATLTTIGAVAAERIAEAVAVHPDLRLDPPVAPPPSRARAWTRADAIVELLRGRLTLAGPVTSEALAADLNVTVRDADAALLALEGEGVVLRGMFSPRAERSEPAERRASEARPRIEWCDRALLARIHRYTVARLRAEIEPVAPADFMRFLFKWQHVDRVDRLRGVDGLREVVGILDGFEAAAGGWERSILAARVEDYEPSMLDMLCLAGEVGWTRLSPPATDTPDPPRLSGSTPIAIFLREHASSWLKLRADADREQRLSAGARAVLDALRARGALFFSDLRQLTGLDDDAARSAVGMLVAGGLAASDGFAGLRALMWSADGRPPSLDRRATFAGRWSDVPAGAESTPEAVEAQAWTLLRRYGVVFRRALTREALAAPWRDLARVYRRLEARGEIRGGRFVAGMSGEQFALPRAVERLREVRRSSPPLQTIVITAADPLNLAGIVTAGERVRASRRTRIAYRAGVPVALREADVVRPLAPLDSETLAEVTRALANTRAALNISNTR